jgi:uncharacterized protein (UPF0332 family)
VWIGVETEVGRLASCPWRGYNWVMARFAPQKNLLRVSKAKTSDIERWKEAKYIETTTGHTVEELVDRAAADRFELAVSFLRSADVLLTTSPPLYRSSISRYYYSMYHAMRAAAFVFHGGDDFEEHRTLPGKAPDDLPSQALWSNTLKDAREQRNRADYDPYPKTESAWRRDAEALAAEARRFVGVVRSYLKSKGCRL